MSIKNLVQSKVSLKQIYIYEKSRDRLQKLQIDFPEIKISHFASIAIENAITEEYTKRLMKG